MRTKCWAILTMYIIECYGIYACYLDFKGEFSYSVLETDRTYKNRMIGIVNCTIRL